MRETNKEAAADPQALVLAALGWLLSDDDRAHRFLGVTGLDPAGLRARLGEPGLLDAVMGFLEAHQPDFLACAAALNVSPDTLAAAHGALYR